MIGLREEIYQVGLFDFVSGGKERDEVTGQRGGIAGDVSDLRGCHWASSREAFSRNPLRGGSTTTRSGAGFRFREARSRNVSVVAWTAFTFSGEL